MDKKVDNAGPANKVVQPETDFAEFYYGIISKLYDLKCRQISMDVKSALRDMRTKINEANVRKHAFFSYKQPSVRCAYMYAYSVLHTVIVYSEFSKFLELNKRFLLPTLYKNSLKICCIGGGPGTEAVAICKAINDFTSKLNTKSDELLLEVDVTVVDKLPHWKREESAVVSAVNDKSNLLHSDRIILNSDFMKADILKPFEKSLQEKIKQADLVTIVKVGCHIQDKNLNDRILDLQNMVRNVTDSMDENSFLFMLDNAGGSVFYSMRNVLREKIGSLRRSDHKEYSLDQVTVQKLSDLMLYRKDSNYHPMLTTGRGKVSSCLWIKNAELVNGNINGSSKKDDLKKMCSENSSSSKLKCEGNPGPSKTESDGTPQSAVSENEQFEGKKKSSKKIKKVKEKLKPILTKEGN